MVDTSIGASASPAALVIGGTRGIGAATVAALVTAGHPVIYTGRRANEAPPVPGAQFRVCDIRDPAQVEDVFAAVCAEYGAPGVIVANAGINVPPASVANFPAERFADLVSVNLTGAFTLLSAAARHCADGGSIIALTTSLVRHPLPGTGPYSATKAAVEVLVRVMQRELSSRGIRVNAVAPGPVDTDLFRAGKDESALARSAAMSPFDRVGTPEEIAAVVAFLASDAASWIAGQIIQPNGALV